MKEKQNVVNIFEWCVIQMFSKDVVVLPRFFRCFVTIDWRQEKHHGTVDKLKYKCISNESYHRPDSCSSIGVYRWMNSIQISASIKRIENHPKNSIRNKWPSKRCQSYLISINCVHHGLFLDDGKTLIFSNCLSRMDIRLQGQISQEKSSNYLYIWYFFCTATSQTDIYI